MLHQREGCRESFEGVSWLSVPLTEEKVKMSEKLRYRIYMNPVIIQPTCYNLCALESSTGQSKVKPVPDCTMGWCLEVAPHLA